MLPIYFFFFFFFQSTAQLQYVEDSRACNEVNVTILNSPKTELQVQKGEDKEVFNLGSSW